MVRPGVKTIVNYDSPDNIDEHVWRVSLDVLGKIGFTCVSFINHSNQNLSVDLEKWLLDTQQEVSVGLEELVMTYVSQRVPTNLDRPSTSHKESQNNFERTTGGSPPQKNSSTWTVSQRKSPDQVEVRRIHVGMRKDDRFCPDCKGFIWRSKTECENDKCQVRSQEASG